MEVREHPGRDPFKILRFLVLIFFAAWFHPHPQSLDTKPKYQPPSRRGGFQLYRSPPQCRLSRSVKSRHPRLKKLIRYLATLAPQSRGNWKGQCRETKYEGREEGVSSCREKEKAKEKERKRNRIREIKRGTREGYRWEDYEGWSCSDYIRQPPRKTSGHFVFPFSLPPRHIISLPSEYE